jgi:TP901 family phage tail tape measure protein
MGEHTLAILVKAIGAAQAAKDLKGVDKAVSDIGARGGKGLRDTGHNLKRLAVAGIGLGAVGIVASVKAAADFESQLNTINTIARATPAELDKIGKSIRGIARATGTPLEDLTQGYYDLLSAGISAADAQKVLENANTLAIGGLSTSAEAVDLLTTAINTYGGDASKAGQFTDEFAKAIERGKVTAADLAATYAGVGPLAASLGIENKELAAGYARLTAGGTEAGEAATQMASAMTALLKQTPKLKALQKQTGKNYAAIAGSQGLNVALEQMRVDADKAGIKLVDLVGRKEALLYILQTTGTNLEAYNADLAAMGDASGTAADQMSERQKGLNFQLQRLKALAIDAGITIGDKLLPKITPLAERAVKFLDTHQPDIERFGDKIAGAFDKAVSLAEKIPWAQMGAGLEIAATWAGDLMDVFTSMPPEVQTTIIALAALNKLSGGAISGVVGELGKGLIKGVLGMNAGVVNIKAGTVVGGGGMGGPGAAGGAGKLASAVSILGAVTIAGASIYALAETFQGFVTGVQQNQDDAQAKVNATASQNFQQSVDNLNAVVSGVMAQNPLQIAATALVAGGQLTSDFEMAADRIVNEQGLTREQTVQALNAMKRAQELGGNLLETPKLDAAIVTLTDRLAKMPTGAGAPGAYRPTGQAGRVNDPGVKAVTSGLRPIEKKTGDVGIAVKSAQSIASRENSAQRSELQNTKNAVVTSRYATVSAVGRAEGASRAAGVASAAASLLSASMIIAAIWASGAANRPVIQSTTVQKTTTINNRYGETGGSRQSDWSPTH